MTTLVTKADLDNYKQVANSVKNAAEWPQCVYEAQMLDVKPWLGDGILDELLTQAATSPESFSTANQTLLDGGSYTYLTKKYLFQGLKAAIIYYAFARFTSRAPYNFTAAGVTVKDTELSAPASDKAIQRLATEAKLTADAIKDEIILFLSRHTTTYTLYVTSTSSPRTFFVLGD